MTQKKKKNWVYRDWEIVKCCYWHCGNIILFESPIEACLIEAIPKIFINFNPNKRKNSIIMQCIRASRGHSPSTTSSLSIESSNEYFNQTLRRKSFLRRSFNLVRRNVARHSLNLSRKNSKTRKIPSTNSSSIGDQNNNLNSRDSTTSVDDTTTTYGRGSLSISTVCDILVSNKKNQHQQIKNR